MNKKKKFLTIIIVLLVLFIGMGIYNSKKSDTSHSSLKDDNSTKSIDKSKETSKPKPESLSESEMAEPARNEKQENQKEYNTVEAGATIELIGEEEMTVSVGKKFVDPGAKALNQEGKDISDMIKIDGEVDINTPGTYKIYYYVGKAIVVREVEVK